MSSPFDADNKERSVDDKLAALLERLATAIRSTLQTAATRHQLSPIQIEALIYLHHHDRPRGRTGILAQQFQISQPTMSDALAVLETKKLITREQSADDARVKEVALTRAGRTLAKKLERWVDPYLAALAGMPGVEKEQAYATLLKLAAELSKANVIAVDRMCLTCRFFRPASGKTTDHYCRLLEMSLGPAALRVDCPEHEPT